MTAHSRFWYTFGMLNLDTAWHKVGRGSLLWHMRESGQFSLLPSWFIAIFVWSNSVFVDKKESSKSTLTFLFSWPIKKTSRSDIKINSFYLPFATREPRRHCEKCPKMARAVLALFIFTAFSRISRVGSCWKLASFPMKDWSNFRIQYFIIFSSMFNFLFIFKK